MSTIAEITLPASEFALRETFSQQPGARFEVVGVVAHGVEHVMPQIRATTSDLPSVRSSLIDDPSVTDAKLLTDLGDRGLFAMKWDGRVHEATTLLTKLDTSILAARAANQTWRFQIQSDDRKTLSTIYESCHDADLPVEVQNVRERTTLLKESHRLTTQQYETLRSAIDRGYYDIPRKVTTEDLADELGISHQAISERLRRGHRSLVESGLSSPDKDRT
ncbi:helix-turn-helix domain-containing protein [Haladaptatus caseinilyticus]|uniref:helix-turn-helix domain-containing protein n=1 Tax=Haladaptatus caseinilyticus TaxID=2993314 RepID=UPI00224A7FAE|nr:helix-turn-helix domain-containing protein [Haladaptatus caseinilyticus]